MRPAKEDQRKKYHDDFTLPRSSKRNVPNWDTGWRYWWSNNKVERHTPKNGSLEPGWGKKVGKISRKNKEEKHNGENL